MAADAIYDAIQAHLQDAAVIAVLADPNTAVVPPIRFENEDFTQPNPPAPWIGMALTGVLYGQQSIGAASQSANRWDETGKLWLPVFAPVGSGASRPRQIAKLLADIFRGLTLLGGSLEFLDTFIGSGGPASEDGNWYELPVIVEYRRIEA